MSRPLVVAVDGPSGSGKSSVSREVARRIDGRYLDTGAMYRAVTLWLLEHGVAPADADAVARVVDAPTLEPGTDPTDPHIRLDGVDVSSRIRDADVTAAVSYASAVPELRARLVGLQRDVVAAAQSAREAIVVEGRDIGLVVLPDADLKVFLTADLEVRAARRHLEQVGRGTQQSEADAMRSLAGRDAIDTTRAASPLRRADDAVVIDATDLELDEVVARIMRLVADAQVRH